MQFPDAFLDVSLDAISGCARTYFIMHVRVHSVIASGESTCERDSRSAVVLPEVGLPCTASAAARYCDEFLPKHVQHRQSILMPKIKAAKSNLKLNFCIPLATLLGPAFTRKATDGRCPAPFKTLRTDIAQLTQ